MNTTHRGPLHAEVPSRDTNSSCPDFHPMGSSVHLDGREYRTVEELAQVLRGLCVTPDFAANIGSVERRVTLGRALVIVWEASGYGTKAKMLRAIGLSNMVAQRAMSLFKAMRDKGACEVVDGADVKRVHITDPKFQGKSLRECEQAFGVRVRSAPTMTKLPEKNPAVLSIEHYGIEYTYGTGGGPRPRTSVEGVPVDEIPAGQRFVAEDGFVWLHARRPDTGDVALVCTGYALIERAARLPGLLADRTNSKNPGHAPVGAAPLPCGAVGNGGSDRAERRGSARSERPEHDVEHGDDQADEEDDEDPSFIDDQDDDDEGDDDDAEDDDGLDEDEEQLVVPRPTSAKPSIEEMRRRAANYKPDPTNVWGHPDQDFDFVIGGEATAAPKVDPNPAQMTLEQEYLAAVARYTQKMERTARAAASGDAAARSEWARITRLLGE